ncbi:MAG: sortase [Chloroflexota bacterium]|nr:sortase [Chloroflexota bacterium]
MLQRVSPKNLLVASKTVVFVVCFTLLSWLLGGASAPTRLGPLPTITPLPPTSTPLAENTPTAIPSPSPTETPRPAKSLDTWLDGTNLLLPEGLPAGLPEAQASETKASETKASETQVPATATAIATVALQPPTAKTPGPLSTVLSLAITNGASRMVPTSTPAPPQNTPTAIPPTATHKPDGTPILPTGAKYGDHNPNVPGRIVRVAAPSIKMDTGVYEVYGINGTWEVADYAAGHHYNSRNPGDGGNIVLSGHNNWRGEVFRDLDKLKPGDEIHVWTQAGKEYVYKVRKIDKLKEVGVSYAQRLKNAQVLNDTPQEQLTLISCWPYTTFTHRLVVTADPVAK